MKKYGTVHIAAILFGTLFLSICIKGALDFLSVANELLELLKSTDGDISPGLVFSGFPIIILLPIAFSFILFLLPLILSVIGIRKKDSYVYLSKIAMWETLIGLVILTVPIAYFIISISQL